MRLLAGVLLAAALLVGARGSASPVAAKTAVVRWSPFEANGTIKPTLHVTSVRGTCTDIGYTFVGGIGYRCGFRNFLLDACFRDGPNPTEYVICIDRPWDTRVIRLRSPRLLLYPGVTFSGPAPYPWGIVLADGNRCGVGQGAHDSVTAHGRRYTVDYACERDDVVLLREGIERGRIWRVNAARWSGLRRGFVFLGHVQARLVYFGTLPPPLARQNRLAHEAYEAAKRIIRRREPKRRLDLAWVRLALPEARWAYVIFTSTDAALDRGWFVVLHRLGGSWTDASRYEPYCRTLPKRVREQLFLAKKNPLGHEAVLAPRGETRC